MLPINLIREQDIEPLINKRPGESKIGEVIGLASQFGDSFPFTGDHDTDNINSRFQFALIGVPEDIGPRGNHGQPGARGAWRAFLSYFLNLQANEHLPGNNILLLGNVECDDLHELVQSQDNTIEALRHACAELDKRVVSVLQEVFQAGLIPIVIGGGHNNAFPIIQACSIAREMPLAVSNMDPHSDFREEEGRHSGNPFRYAQSSGYLERYAVLGLHEQKNNQASLNALKALEFPWFSIQQTHWSNSHNFDQCLEQIAKYMLESGLPVGIELDLDAISNMPSSAITAAGISLQDALYYVSQMAALPSVQYLHLAEGAPEKHTSGIAEGNRIVGQSLCELVAIFIKSVAQQA